MVPSAPQLNNTILHKRITRQKCSENQENYSAKIHAETGCVYNAIEEAHGTKNLRQQMQFKWTQYQHQRGNNRKINIYCTR